MNGQALYELTTSLLDGSEINEVLFYQLLNMAKSAREGKRDWTVLKKKDLSITALPSDTLSTAKSVPTDFLRPIKGTLKSTPIVLLDSSNRKVMGLTEILLERQYDYNGTPGFFFVDYVTRAIYFTGPVSQNYTAALFYISSTPDITESGEWTPFPDQFHPLLAYDVAMKQKGDIDFDDINARMVQFMGQSMESLDTAMIMWDDRMKLSALGV